MPRASSIATNAYVLFVNQKVPASNLKDLIVYARANQETLNIGDFGATGTIQLLTSQLMEGMNLTRVSYKGASEMILALLAGGFACARISREIRFRKIPCKAPAFTPSRT